MSGDGAPEVDSEALQAQIDLSMSLTFDMVSSWMQVPEGSKLLDDGEEDDDQRELEQYLRRPTTLGVGAPIPSSSGGGDPATSREILKLRHTLMKGGSSSQTSSVHSKHGRDDFSGASSSKTNGVVNGRATEGSEDDEDSRASSLNAKKRPMDSRLSVFELKPRRKKKKTEDDAVFATPNLPSPSSLAFPSSVASTSTTPILLTTGTFSPPSVPSTSLPVPNGNTPHTSPPVSKAASPSKSQNRFGLTPSPSPTPTPNSRPTSPTIKRIFPNAFDPEDDIPSTPGSSQTLLGSFSEKSQTRSLSPVRRASKDSNTSLTPKKRASEDSEDEDSETGANESSTRTPTPSVNGAPSSADGPSKKRNRKRKRRKRNKNGDASGAATTVEESPVSGTAE